MVKAKEAHMSKAVLPLWVIRESFQETEACGMRLEGWGGRKPFVSPNGVPMCMVLYHFHSRWAEGEEHHLHLTGEEAEAQRGGTGVCE